MIDLDNKRLTLENDSTYEVIEQVVYNGKTYVYLVNVDDSMDSLFKELLIVDNHLHLDDINSQLFEYKIFPLFADKFKEYND